MRLRTVLGQLVVLTLATSCHREGKPRVIGGGCPPTEVKGEKLGPELDDKLRALLAACTSPETCKPVCEELNERKHRGDSVDRCEVTKSGESEATVSFVAYHYCAGRRPCGLVDDEAPADTLADWMARQGALEAASVVAFEELAAELRRHGAPEHLIAACLEAAEDEARHAERCGASLLPARAASPARSIEELAIDNAIEGEVRETWGAVTAAWQAHTAGSAHVRAVMAEIAPEELRHAELSAELAAWYTSQLDDAARARVAMAKASAIEALVAGLARPPADELVRECGLPDAADAARLLAGLRATVWA